MNLRQHTTSGALALLSICAGAVSIYATAGLLSYGSGGNNGGPNEPECDADRCCYICKQNSCEQIEWEAGNGSTYYDFCWARSMEEGAGGYYSETEEGCFANLQCGNGGNAGGNNNFNSSPPATCYDGQDNDGDGFVDGDDPDCFLGGSAQEHNDDRNYSSDPSTCYDGIDNEPDGFTDMDDPDCSNSMEETNDDSHSSSSPPPTCYDGQDNDGDGMVDSADPDCAQGGSAQENHHNSNGSSSSGPAPTCNDGQDNDGDGFTDGADPDCYGNGNGNEMNASDSADLTAQISGPNVTRKGEIYSYTVTIQNQGTAFADSIDLHIALGNAFTYIGNQDFPCNRNNNTFHCTFTLQPQEQWIHAFQVFVNDYQPRTDCWQILPAVEVSTYTTTFEGNRNNNATALRAYLQCEEESPQESPALHETASSQQTEAQYREQERTEELQEQLQERQIRNAVQVQSQTVSQPQPALGCFTANGVWTENRTDCGQNQEQYMNKQEVPKAPVQLNPEQEEQIRKKMEQKFLGRNHAEKILQTIGAMRKKLVYMQGNLTLNDQEKQMVGESISWLEGQTAFFTTQQFSQENIDVCVEGIKRMTQEMEKMQIPEQAGPKPEISNIITRTWSLLQKTYDSLQLLYQEQVMVNPKVITDFQQANTMLVDIQNRCFTDEDACSELNGVLEIIDGMLAELQRTVDASGNAALEERIRNIFAQ